MPSMYRVQLKSTGWTGSPGLNTWYFLGTPDSSVTSSDQAQACVERVHSQFVGFSGFYPSFWRGQVEPQVDMIDAATGRLTNTFVSGTSTGLLIGGAAGSGPIAAAVVVNLLTEAIVAGKRITGKTFLSPLSNAGDADGTPSQALRDACGSVIYGLIVAPGAPTLCVWHRPKLGAGGSAHIVTGVLVKDKYAVLTSRRD